jgi:hypothetical protein
MAILDGGGKRSVCRWMLSLYGPLLFVLVYLAFTFLVFAAGPIRWSLTGREYALAGLISMGCLVTLALGYFVNVRRDAGLVLEGLRTGDGYLRLGRITVLLFIVSACFNILAVWSKLLLQYSPALNLWQCILNPGLGYVQGQQLQSLYEAGNIPGSIARYELLFRALALLSGLGVFWYPLGWLAWRMLRLWMKLLFLFSLASTLLYYWIIGTQMGFGMLVFAALPVFIYRSACAGCGKAPHGKRAGRNAAAQLTALVLAFVLLFAGMQLSRAGAKNAQTLDIGSVVKNESLYTLRWGGAAESKAMYGAMMLTFYVGHGYAGLGKSTGLPFKWTYGLGWSYGLLQLSEKYAGVSGVWERTYLYRNERINHWPALAYWSTLYPWLASDVTYWGVPVAMGLAGMFFAAMWKDLTARRSAIAATVLAQLFQLFAMVPANNQLFNTISGFFSSVLVLALYILSRTRLWRRWEGGGNPL